MTRPILVRHIHVGQPVAAPAYAPIRVRTGALENPSADDSEARKRQMLLVALGVVAAGSTVLGFYTNPSRPSLRKVAFGTSLVSALGLTYLLAKPLFTGTSSVTLPSPATAAPLKLPQAPTGVGLPPLDSETVPPIATTTTPTTPANTSRGFPPSIPKTHTDAVLLANIRGIIQQSSGSLITVSLAQLQDTESRARASNFLAEAALLDQLIVDRAKLDASSRSTALALYAALISNQSKFEAPMISDLYLQLVENGLDKQAADLAQRFPGPLAEEGVTAPLQINPNTSTLPASLKAQIDNYLNPASQPKPAQIDALVNFLQAKYPGGFLTEIGNLQRRANDLRPLPTPAAQAAG